MAEYPLLSLRPSHIARRYLASMSRSACIVAAGKFGGSYCLLKNRDRNYLPEITLIHEVRDGVEVAYFKDASTGWVEGLNEFGIGIVNAALMVSRDESERDEVERTGKKLKDGERILKALTEKTVVAAAKSVRTYKEGLKGHTIISDGEKTIYVEMPDSNDIEYDEVPTDELFVRTNHGVEFPDAGYVDGKNEKSSKTRQEAAEEVLAEVKSPDDVAPALLRAREDRWEPTEMVRDNKSSRKMRTTSQMVLDLTRKKLTFYILPGRIEFKGVKDKLPEGHKPKLTVEVREYEDLSEDTDGETKKMRTASLLPILDPAFNIREIFKQLVLLEDHLFHPRKQCPDCIWKHLLTCEAFAEEAVTLDVQRRYHVVLDGLAERIRDLARAVQDHIPFDEIAQKAREIRKGLLGVASHVKVGGLPYGASSGNITSCYAPNQIASSPSGPAGSVVDTTRVPHVAPLMGARNLERQRGSAEGTTTSGGHPDSRMSHLHARLPHSTSANMNRVADLQRCVGTADPTTVGCTGMVPRTPSSVGGNGIVGCRDAKSITAPRVTVSGTTTCGNERVAQMAGSVASRVLDMSLGRDTGYLSSMDGSASSTGSSWNRCLGGGSSRMSAYTTSTGTGSTTDLKTWNSGPWHTHQASESRMSLSGPDVFSTNMKPCSPNDEPYFSEGDIVTFGRFQNKPAKIIRLWKDERGIPMVEIEPVPKGRKKNRSFSLFRIRHMDMAKRVAARWAGTLVQFPTRAAPVRPKHTVTIGGKKYTLSADGGPLGDQLDALSGGDGGGAQVVDMPAFMKPEPYRFLWAYDTEDGSVSMWRVTDGNSKVWGSADGFASKIVELDRKGELNRVTSAEMAKLDRAMRKKEDEQLRSLKKWLAENADDYQKFVDKVAWDVFNRDVKPGLEKRLQDAKRGVVPIGFKVQEDQLDYRSRGDQLRSHILTEEMAKFTVEKIEDEVRSRGVDPDAPGHDIQAAYWAMNDVVQEVWEKYSRFKLAGDPLVKVAEGKYKEKKEVPKADGKGTTTVYVYSEKQIEHRHREKAKRYEGLSKNIDKLRKQVTKDIDSDDPKTRLTALAVGLIDATFERVGNDGSADDGHFGVTGWLKKHVTFGKGKATIKYVGKSGVDHEKVVDDKKLVAALKDCCGDKNPDDTLLSFGKDDDEGPVKISSRDVNAYLKPFDVTAKDLRGFHANREMQDALRSVRKKGPTLPSDKKEKEKVLKDEFKKALEQTAEAVGHEAATLRTQYLVPGLEDAYMKDGTIIDKIKSGSAARVAAAWRARVDTTKAARVSLPARVWVDADAAQLDLSQENDVWEVYLGSYRAIGLSLRSVRDLTFESPTLWCQDVDADGSIDAFISYKHTASGNKITFLGSDGTPEAKRSLMQKMLGLLAHPGWYIEASHRLAEILERVGVVKQTDEGVVRQVLRKDLQWYGDGSYERAVSGVGVIRKSLFGHPRVTGRTATKSEAEREDEEIERLVRPPPKKKPSRDDSKRERVDTSQDEDRDPDLSLNYKDVGG